MPAWSVGCIDLRTSFVDSGASRNYYSFLLEDSVGDVGGVKCAVSEDDAGSGDKVVVDLWNGDSVGVFENAGAVGTEGEPVCGSSRVGEVAGVRVEADGGSVDDSGAGGGRSPPVARFMQVLVCCTMRPSTCD